MIEYKEYEGYDQLRGLTLRRLDAIDRETGMHLCVNYTKESGYTYEYAMNTLNKAVEDYKNNNATK